MAKILEPKFIEPRPETSEFYETLTAEPTPAVTASVCANHADTVAYHIAILVALVVGLVFGHYIW